ncbi:UDP-N-acetylmuramoyl-L-alanyl-D-glutamate--2,6-diaminopimelate ligase [Parvularcula dongshanensis]|uniref:UDP-N-acetylmuramoyl-L-alanyl-D-glutamate--2,6-diaminopimelate ligase n=1 Tax=Parvularcula dongshanensis TaxID=1173995 RepID=A0A840I6J6_9PROT|nr:UDP-N-acetylmuramoyl-L-alanyl-D-glutamate--2,6-diaminopimelate ligase [Parvularcula dongshanensis]MBB4659873.1 UDP-N-acetylmuramoyl-L-alanyl-D-glutamate--2,6-diaminopimelate ligase [Parvularcula dongshanensis]
MKLQHLHPLAAELPDAEVTGVTADSRAVEPGFVFAALPGSRADGRRFIPQAVEAGAVAIIAPTGTKADVPVLESEEPRLTLAEIASRLHHGQPAHVAGITGTNGKTSVARFTGQLWNALGHKAGTLGTLGAVAPGYDYALRHTTPDPVEIHQVLSTMASLGTTHLAMEVSSHGLAQHRADGVAFSQGAFTNITQDHLDYHPDFEDYFKAKLRLLTGLLPEGRTAVICADGAGADRVMEETRAAGRTVFSTGREGSDLKLVDLAPTPTGLRIVVEADGRSHELHLPLIGAFQADNALVAAGLAVTSGHDLAAVLPCLAEISAAPGRMEHAGTKRMAGGEAAIYVDYAHTPDAVRTALAAARPHAEGRVAVLLGAGGDRDRAKRPLMGRAAAEGADLVFVTDDNPRTEEAGPIREAVASGAPGARIVANRAEAIGAAVDALEPGDVLIVAGKGHEKYQIVGDVTYPFDDVAVAGEAAKAASVSA